MPLESDWRALDFENTRQILRERVCSGDTNVPVYKSCAFLRSIPSGTDKLLVVQADYSEQQYDREATVIESIGYSGQQELIYNQGCYVDRNGLQPIVFAPVVEELMGGLVVVHGLSALFYWLERGNPLSTLPFIKIKHVLMRPVPEAVLPQPLPETLHGYLNLEWERSERGERRRLVPER